MEYVADSPSAVSPLDVHTRTRDMQLTNQTVEADDALTLIFLVMTMVTMMMMMMMMKMKKAKAVSLGLKLESCCGQV